VDKPYYLALQRQPSALDCAIYEKVCRDEVLQKHDDIEQYLKDNATWYSRYKTFIAMRDFKSLSNPAKHPSIQDYSVLMDGNRMVGLDALSKAISGKPQKAYAQLQENIEHIRVQLQMSDNNAIFDKHAYGTAVGRLYDGSMRLFFKPGMTANLLRQDIQNSRDLARLSHEELKSAANIKHEHTVTWQDYVFNFMGTYTTTGEMLDHTNKISLVFDLDAKVRLYNHMYGPDNTNGMEALFTFVNPYYRRTDFISTDLDNNQVCFDGMSTGIDSIQCVLYANKPFAVSLL